MTSRRTVGLAAFLLLSGPLLGWAFYPQGGEDDKDVPKQPSAEEMAEMMKKMAQFTQPGEQHKFLEKFVGKWDTEVRGYMGGRATPPEKGTAETKWLMPGRWLQTSLKGTMMGVPMESFSILGYDNFKMSFVGTTVSGMDTAMLRYEGDMDPGGKTLLMYGTLDEYLTGEHDKMVKYVWRFESDDKVVMEIHDLPIGENNTKVIEIAFTRAK